MNIQNNYECPYCCSEVTLQATVCAHCGRDLVMFRPLAIQVQGLKQEISELRECIEEIKLDAQSASLVQDEASVQQLLDDQNRKADWFQVIQFALVCLAGAGLAHWMMLFVYDVQPVLLRLLTIFIPALAAFAFAPRMSVDLKVHAAISFAVAVLAVALMLGITSWIDAVSWWPQSTRDQKEVFEYIVSITLASWTGRYLYQLKARERIRVQLSQAFNKSISEKKSIVTLVKQVKDATENLTPIVSGAVALYSGLKSFLD